MLADMYSVLDVARYVIARSNRAGAISNLKLQKVLYFIQAEFLVVQNTPCFAEQIEAWDFGPVVPMVYYRYRIYGGAAFLCYRTMVSVRSTGGIRNWRTVSSTSARSIPPPG